MCQICGKDIKKEFFDIHSSNCGKIKIGKGI